MQQGRQTCMSRSAGAPQGWPGSTCHGVSPPNHILAGIPLLPDLSKKPAGVVKESWHDRQLQSDAAAGACHYHSAEQVLCALHADIVKEPGAHHMCWRGSGPRVICLTMSAGQRSAEQEDLQQRHSETPVLVYAHCHW